MISSFLSKFSIFYHYCNENFAGMPQYSFVIYLLPPLTLDPDDLDDLELPADL